MLLQRLSADQKEKLQKLWDADYQTIVSGKDNGVPYLKYLFEIHFKLFGETCSHCTTKYPGYIKKIKNLNPKNIMSKEVKTSELFRLNEMTTIPVRGTTIVYSNANLTDEIAIKLLAENPNRKILFAKLPTDVDERIEAYKNAEPVAATSEEGKKEATAEVVVIGDKHLTVEQAVALLEKLNLKTKATTVAGVGKFITGLTDDQKAELINLSAEVKDETPADETGSRTRDEVMFDLEKAEQDLAEAINVDNKAKIEEIKQTIESLQKELETLA